MVNWTHRLSGRKGSLGDRVQKFYGDFKGDFDKGLGNTRTRRVVIQCSTVNDDQGNSHIFQSIQSTAIQSTSRPLSDSSTLDQSCVYNSIESTNVESLTTTNHPANVDRPQPISELLLLLLYYVLDVLITDSRTCARKRHFSFHCL